MCQVDNFADIPRGNAGATRFKAAEKVKFGHMKVLASLLAGAAVLLPAAAAHAGETVVARYTFDQGFAEASGSGATLALHSRNGGTVEHVPRGTGYAAAFPVRCLTSSGCPRAILQGTDDARLDPGARPFRFGAWLAVRPDQTAAGSNIMQKGYHNSESQWKLQVDGSGGRPSCVLVGRGSTRRYIAQSTVSIADGGWHQVTCQRAASTVTVWVDGVARGSAPIPSGLTVANGQPLRLGGKNDSLDNDQYWGAMDDVFFAVS
jgi:hypothetical protein